MDGWETGRGCPESHREQELHPRAERRESEEPPSERRPCARHSQEPHSEPEPELHPELHPEGQEQARPREEPHSERQPELHPHSAAEREQAPFRSTPGALGDESSPDSADAPWLLRSRVPRP